MKDFGAARAPAIIMIIPYSDTFKTISSYTWMSIPAFSSKQWENTTPFWRLQSTIIFSSSKATNPRIDSFYKLMCIKYSIKHLCRPTESLGWSISYTDNLTIFLNQPALVQTKIGSAGLVEANKRNTPYNYIMYLTVPHEIFKIMMEICSNTRLLSDFRYFSYRTKLYLAYITGKLTMVMQTPTTRH